MYSLTSVKMPYMIAKNNNCKSHWPAPWPAHVHTHTHTRTYIYVHTAVRDSCVSPVDDELVVQRLFGKVMQEPYGVVAHELPHQGQQQIANHVVYVAAALSTRT